MPTIPPPSRPRRLRLTPEPGEESPPTSWAVPPEVFRHPRRDREEMLRESFLEAAEEEAELRAPSPTPLEPLDLERTLILPPPPALPSALSPAHAGRTQGWWKRLTRWCVRLSRRLALPRP